jgi:hypothetical protein
MNDTAPEIAEKVRTRLMEQMSQFVEKGAESLRESASGVGCRQFPS